MQVHLPFFILPVLRIFSLVHILSNIVEGEGFMAYTPASVIKMFFFILYIFIFSGQPAFSKIGFNTLLCEITEKTLLLTVFLCFVFIFSTYSKILQ